MGYMNFLQKLLLPRLHPGNIKPVFLLILDGWGIAPPSYGNVIARSRLPNLERYLKEYPNGELIAAGESVGLPANEVGNTEVGHLTMGSGRVTYQGLKRINLALEDDSYLRNKAFWQAIEHVKQHNSQLHLMGILSSGNVHGALPHFYGLLEICRRAQIDKVFIHAFTDGRDAPPNEALELFKEVEAVMQEKKVGQFATVSGRYYAMDRDRRWERIQKTYEAMVLGKGPTQPTIYSAIEDAYKQGLTDELIVPTVLTKNDQPIATINDHDACIFFNFRIDRPRQLTMALTMPDFEHFQADQFGYSENLPNQGPVSTFHAPIQREKVPQDLYFVTMTNYHKNLPVQAVAFDTPLIEKPLGEVLQDNNLTQLHMAESEKERFVTYYFNGFHEESYPGQKTIIVPSPKVSTYDRKPEMSVAELTTLALKNLARDEFHFIVMNIANPDMVAHTGNIQATLKAIKATDIAVGQIVEGVLACDGTVFLTADHGNAEELITYPTTSFFFTSSQGTVNTDHSNNPVPFIIINKALKGKELVSKRGCLADVAPTILSFMGLTIPPQMTGKNLLQ